MKKRLTIRNQNPMFGNSLYLRHGEESAALNKLAAYEDIGIEPNEVQSLVARADKAERIVDDYKFVNDEAAAADITVLKALDIAVNSVRLNIFVGHEEEMGVEQILVAIRCMFDTGINDVRKRTIVPADWFEQHLRDTVSRLRDSRDKLIEKYDLDKEEIYENGDFDSLPVDLLKKICYVDAYLSVLSTYNGWNGVDNDDL